MLNQSHPLYKPADKIDWSKFDTAFAPLYCHNNGHPAKPIRLMCGLLILKHLRNLSDESVVEQWSENAYCQYFCSMQEFTPGAPRFQIAFDLQLLLSAKKFFDRYAVLLERAKSKGLISFCEVSP